MPRPGLLALPLLLLIAVSGVSCGPRPLVLPTGPGIPAADYAEAWAEATSGCSDIRTVQAEIALSGHAGRQRLRGRVLGGFAPGALRLEAVSPFGSPAFILVADGGRGTLLLPGDRRVLQDAPPADILNALVGVPLGPDDLRALVTGCLTASTEAAGGRRYGVDWIAVDLASGGSIFLRRLAPSGWRVEGGRLSGLEIEYDRFDRSSGTPPGRPAQIHLRSASAGAAADVDLTLRLSQVDINGELPREQLVAVKIPPGLSPISLEDLRRSGPLGY